MRPFPPVSLFICRKWLPLGPLPRRTPVEPTLTPAPWFGGSGLCQGRRLPPGGATSAAQPLPNACVPSPKEASFLTAQPRLEGLSLFVKHPTGSDRFPLRTCLGSHGRLCSYIFSLFLCSRVCFPVSQSVSQPQALGHGKRNCQTCILTSVPLGGRSLCLRPCTYLVFFILHVTQTGN